MIDKIMFPNYFTLKTCLNLLRATQAHLDRVVAVEHPVFLAGGVLKPTTGT